MEVEIRADNTIRIFGYANVPGRLSRPVITPRGRVVEMIEQRAFAKAIERAQKIDLMLDHEKVIASTENGTFKVSEDEVGLRAEAIISDAETVQGAKNGQLKGWSFNMRNVVDSMEERADQLPIRHVSSFDMSEVTLAMRKIPVYSSTSLEIRGNDEEPTEYRCSDQVVNVTAETKKIDYSEYEKVINELQAGR